MSTAMDQIHRIRELFYMQGFNISEIAIQLNLDWKTVRKYVDKSDFNLPAPKSADENKFCPKLDPFKHVIDGWLEEDLKAPRKQRHTAKRVFNRLKKETEDFDCSYRLIAEYVASKKKDLCLGRKEGYIPLEHHFGDAQADFGSADFQEDGSRLSGKYFVLSFPSSNAGYLQLNYGENMECLLEGMKAIFEHLGGVPKEIWYDNTKTIVTKIIKGGGRQITERFQRFQAHYGFKAVFMNGESGWEKGNVENKVGYGRRNLLVPIPRFVKLSDYNKQLLIECDGDSNREHYRYNETIAELFEVDKKQLLPLPAIPFDTAGYGNIVANNWGKFYLHKGMHEYSVSPSYAGKAVNYKMTSSHVIVMDENMNPVVSHRRLYGDTKQQSMNWLPYLKYIALKPRSLRNSGIFDMMPGQMQQYLDSCQNSERGQVLKVLSELTDRTGFDSALNTVNQAIIYHANNVDSLQSLYRRLYSTIPELPPLRSTSAIPKVVSIRPNLADYDAALKGGVAHG